MIQLIYWSDNKVCTVKLLRGDAKYRQGVRKLELHSIKNLYPLELSITHNHVADSEVDQNLLNLEVEDLSAEIDEPHANFEDQDESENIDPTINFNENSEPEEMRSFNDQVAETETLEDNSPSIGPTDPSLNVINEPEQATNEESEGPPNVSSRGRVRRAIRRPLDNDFIWE